MLRDAQCRSGTGRVPLLVLTSPGNCLPKKKIPHCRQHLKQGARFLVERVFIIIVRRLCLSPLTIHTPCVLQQQHKLPVHPIAMDTDQSGIILTTSIAAFVGGFVFGVWTIRGYLIPPSLKEERRRNLSDPVESDESDIGEDDGPMDHAPSWVNGLQADRSQGLSASSLPKQQKTSALANSNEECKLVLVVRTDLGMTKGKFFWTNVLGTSSPTKRERERKHTAANNTVQAKLPPSAPTPPSPATKPSPAPPPAPPSAPSSPAGRSTVRPRLPSRPSRRTRYSSCAAAPATPASRPSSSRTPAGPRSRPGA